MKKKIILATLLFVPFLGFSQENEVEGIKETKGIVLINEDKNEFIIPSDDIVQTGVKGAAVGGYVGAKAGAVIGAAVGGPIGAEVGSFVGGAVGGYIGDKLGDKISDKLEENNKNN